MDNRTLSHRSLNSLNHYNWRLILRGSQFKTQLTEHLILC